MARTDHAFLFRSGHSGHFCAETKGRGMDKPDRRVRRTRESLHKALISLALEKHYDSITVQEVLDRADVGRSTFYTHFQSLDELLISGTQELRRTLHAALENQRKSAKRHENVIAVVRQNSATLNFVRVTMLQASPHCLSFQTDLNFGEGVGSANSCKCS